MTDAEVIKDEYFDEDFLGNKINIGDEVIFEAPKYRDFVIGKVITKAKKSCQIEYVNDWNYPTKGRTEIVRQFYCQMIKHPADLINRKDAEIERLRSKHRLNLLTQLDIAEKIKAEAIKEFAERLKTHTRKMQSSDFSGEFWDRAVLVSDIDNLVKETAGEC